MKSAVGTVLNVAQERTPPRSLDWGLGRYESTAEQLMPAARVVVDSAALRPGERVVDLGCGTGNAALLAAACGAQVVGQRIPSLDEIFVARVGSKPAELVEG